MPAPQGATVTGATELRRAFRRLDDRVTDLADAHEGSAQMVAQQARGNAPVLTSTLRDSIRVDTYEGGAGVIAGGPGVPYAWVIHFGWRRHNIEPQPFLYDALDERYDAVLRRYDEKVDADIKRFDREAPK